MANVTHASLTGAELHEPKGVDSASANAVYVADGANSGTWTVQYTLNRVYLSEHFPDVGAAGASHYTYPGFGGTIDKICVVLDSSVSSNTVLTAKIGGTSVTGGAVTLVASGSGAGSVFTATPTALNSFTDAQPIEIETDGAAASGEAHITYHLTRTS